LVHTYGGFSEWSSIPGKFSHLLFYKGIELFYLKPSLIIIYKVRTSTLSELKKQLPIADPRHTKHFLEKIKIHYESNDDSPEMQQEKLWMLATSAMSLNIKVK
jgi:hypothetical protein